MTYTAPKGVFDLLPGAPSWQASEVWAAIEEEIRETCRDYGFREVRTPIFERTELFTRSVGESSDIVTKEMYTFLDKGERSMTLRPEGTAPVMRALIESKTLQENPIQKLFYMGPMFRYERPQAGRYRQHHQFGAEAVGSNAPEQDVELIDLLLTLFDRLELNNLSVVINSIGNEESRQRFRSSLRDFLTPHLADLSEDSLRRFESNPLRILDSKDKQDRKILQGAPSILDALDSEASDHFEEVKRHLTALKLPFSVNPSLVRGLDYYNGTVFEVMTEELGAQNSLGGGGRYDGLLKQLGGPDLPAIGFGSGMERIIQTKLQQESDLETPLGPAFFMIPIGDDAIRACFAHLHEMRALHIPSEMDFSGRKVKKAMAYANKINARYTAVVGDLELETNQVKVKELATGEETTVALSDLSIFIASRTAEFESDLFEGISEQMMELFQGKGEDK